MSLQFRTRFQLFVIAVTLCGVSSAVRASVFDPSHEWTPNSAGMIIIPVCIVAGSDVQQKGDKANSGLIHDKNPSLANVISHVKQALVDSWERNSPVRFVDWRDCSALTPSEQTKAIGLRIHPDASNKSTLGPQGRGKISATDPTTHFQPWGADFNRCITYNWKTTHVEYSYKCVEQYAIHEFGHVLGFKHEWTHPKTPAGCKSKKKSEDASDPKLIVHDPHTYDWDSIMTYDDVCANVTGPRFGSENLSSLDRAALASIYPVNPIDNVRVALYNANTKRVLVMSPDGKLTATARDTRPLFITRRMDDKPGQPQRLGDDAMLFTVINVGGEEIALYNEKAGRFLRMNEKFEIDSTDAGGPVLPSSWGHERFKIVDGRDSATVGLYSRNHNRFLRIGDTGVVDASVASSTLNDGWNWERLTIVRGPKRDDVTSVLVADGMWGDWSNDAQCLDKGRATGFALRVEGKQGSGDDTALNAVRLQCTSGPNRKEITPHDGFWGDWGAMRSCPNNGKLVAARMKIEPAQGNKDDSGGNDVSFKCSDGSELGSSNGGPWGNWGSYASCPANTEVCGISVRVEAKQGSSDDTAMNGLKLLCCR